MEFQATNHHWLRLREADGTLLFETSADDQGSDVDLSFEQFAFECAPE